MALFLARTATKHRKMRYFYINIFLKKMTYFLKKHYGWNKQSATILVGKREEHPLKSHNFGCVSLLYGPITFSPPFTVYRVNNCGKNCASFYGYQIFWKEIDIWYSAISDIYSLLVFLYQLVTEGQIVLNFFLLR